MTVPADETDSVELRYLAVRVLLQSGPGPTGIDSEIVGRDEGRIVPNWGPFWCRRNKQIGGTALSVTVSGLLAAWCVVSVWPGVTAGDDAKARVVKRAGSAPNRTRQFPGTGGACGAWDFCKLLP